MVRRMPWPGNPGFRTFAGKLCAARRAWPCVALPWATVRREPRGCALPDRRRPRKPPGVAWSRPRRHPTTSRPGWVSPIGPAGPSASSRCARCLHRRVEYSSCCRPRWTLNGGDASSGAPGVAGPSVPPHLRPRPSDRRTGRASNLLTRAFCPPRPAPPPLSSRGPIYASADFLTLSGLLAPTPVRCLPQIHRVRNSRTSPSGGHRFSRSPRPDMPATTVVPKLPEGVPRRADSYSAAS